MVLFLVGSLGICRAGARDFCSALAAPVSPVQKKIFSHRTLFQFLYPHRLASRAGGQYTRDNIMIIFDFFC